MPRVGWFVLFLVPGTLVPTVVPGTGGSTCLDGWQATVQATVGHSGFVGGHRPPDCLLHAPVMAMHAAAVKKAMHAPVNVKWQCMLSKGNACCCKCKMAMHAAAVKMAI